jgi:RimJ/RimL family protein N-acetyltransferase
MVNMKFQIKLKKVSTSDCLFLYDLLKERDSNVNISHKKMPTYNQHIKFVTSQPYSKWYIIQQDIQSIGSIYLSKQNEIGIFLIKNMRGKKIGQMALEMIMKKHPKKKFLANVNPKNKKSIDFFIENDFKLIQYTYELLNTGKDK